MEWQVFDQLHGLPDRRTDRAAGVITATMVNIIPQPRKGRKRKRLYPPDFFPWLKQEKPAASPTAMRGVWSEIVAASGGLIREVPSEHDSEPDSDAGP